MVDAMLRIPSERLKGIRESLAFLQSLVAPHRETVREHLQILINEIDVNRPLGTNGKHGNLHTATCGCSDKHLWRKYGDHKHKLKFVTSTEHFISFKCTICDRQYITPRPRYLNRFYLTTPTPYENVYIEA